VPQARELLTEMAIIATKRNMWINKWLSK
jgi:hypothetical protein